MRGAGLRWALLASVVVNIVVLGAVIGALWSGDGGPGAERRGGGGGSSEIVGMIRNLDGGSRRAVIRALRRDPALRAARTDLQAARAALRNAMQADPLDRDAVTAAMRAQIAAQSIAAERGLSILIDELGDLSAEERRSLMSAPRDRRIPR